jgi:serine/threonine protein kinase
MQRPLSSPLGALHPLCLIHAGRRAQVWAVATDDGAQLALKRASLAQAHSTTALHARLTHPAVVPLLAHWADDAHAYQLTPLYAASAHDHPPPLERAAAWAARIAEALVVLHDQGWAHCDLWPGNVLIDAQGQPALADFDRATPFGQRAGAASPLYTAPEALLDAPVTPARDVYALGVIFCEWLAGAHPWAALPAPQAIRRQFEAPLPPIDPRCDDLIAAMTHKDAAQRPAARAVLSRLKN